FLEDNSPDKREKKIDELLAHPLHAALWATKFSDITGNNTDALENPAPRKPRLSQAWHEGPRKPIADNAPNHEIVKGILDATSHGDMTPEKWVEQQSEIDKAIDKGSYAEYAARPSLDLFWRRQQNNIPPDQWGQKTAAAFLGVRLECAECHKHP